MKTAMKALFWTILLLMLRATAVMASDTTTVLHYLVREPKIQSEHPPVLFLLHGVGSNEADLFSFAELLPAKYLVISARAPIRLGDNSFAWYQVDFSSGKPVFDFQQAEESRAKLLQFIAEIQEIYAVDGNEIYLCGFSQGAIMSYSIGLTRPDVVTGIAVMSGRLLEEIKPLLASPDKLQKLKIFIAHGTDDNVLQIQHARQAVAYLKSLHLQPSYKEYKEGHGINNQMLADLVAWLK